MSTVFLRTELEKYRTGEKSAPRVAMPVKHRSIYEQVKIASPTQSEHAYRSE
jgi:hypothetical protein